MPNKASVLSSWKDIAQYLGKGVRTVQRWEAELGLPVHRPQGRDRQIVLAFPEELDRWLRNQSHTISYNPARAVAHADANLTRLHELMHAVREQVETMLQQSRALSERVAGFKEARNGHRQQVTQEAHLASRLEGAA